MAIRKLYNDAERKRLMADMLTQQAMTPMQMGGGMITPEYGVGHGLTQLGQALLARRAGKKATEAETKAADERQQMMAQALQGLGPEASMMAGGQAQPINPYQQFHNYMAAGGYPEVGAAYLKRQGPQQTAGPETKVAKIQADVDSGRITPEQGQALIDAELRQGTSSLQSDTGKMRGDFRRDVEGPRASLSGLAAAENLLATDNAIADTAAFTSFIRAIDNSVVRPAEQQAYNKALGLRNQIEATVQQWAGKGPLPPQTKQALVDSVRQLRTTMEGIVDRTVEFYSGEAEKFKLDPESVTGIPIKFDQVDVPIAAVNELQPSQIQPQIQAIDQEMAEIDRMLEEARRQARGN